MDLPAGHTEDAESTPHRVDEPRGTAHEAVSLHDVGDECGQRGEAELVGLVVTDLRTREHVHHCSFLRHEPVELRPEDDGVVARDPEHQRHVSSLRRRERIHQRPQRRDPDAARQQQHGPPSMTILCEGAVWTLREHTRATAHRLQKTRVVTERFDRDAQPAIGRSGREGERMGLPPTVPGQEAPQEELPRLCTDLAELSSRDGDRNDTRALRIDAAHAKTVPRVEPQGLQDTPEDDGAEDCRVQRHPPEPSRAVVREVGADRQLVREPERDREVRVQMHEVPGLAPKAGPGKAHRGDGNCDEQREPDEGHQYVGVVREKAPGLLPQRLVGARRIPHRDQHRVRDEQCDCRESVPPVPDGEAVQTHVPLEPGHSGHEEQLQQHGVRADQAGQLPRRGSEPTRPARIRQASVAEPQTDHDHRVGRDGDDRDPGAVAGPRPLLGHHQRSR